MNISPSGFPSGSPLVFPSVSPPASPPISQRGFTLIELMIGLLLALVSIAMIVQVFVITELRKRDVAGGSDAQQTAAMMLHHLDVALRQAGSGMVRAKDVWGCGLRVSKGGVALLPAPQDFSGPFAGLPKKLRMAPVAVQAGGHTPASRESDRIVVMGGGAEAPGVAFRATGNHSAAGIPMRNSNGFVPGDVLVVVNSPVGGDCHFLQVADTFAPTYTTSGILEDTPKTVPVGGAFGASGAAAIDAGSAIFNLGTRPQFYLFGVDQGQQTLIRHDLLQLRQLTGAAPIGENVFLMRVLYGLDDGSGGGKAGDNIVDRWISPAETGWRFSELQDGTAQAAEKIDRIKAVRVALVTRATYPREGQSEASLLLFDTLDASLRQTVALTDTERRFRYQVYETVIPLVNMRMLARS